MPSPTIRIFVVDDHPLVREWLINLLKSQPDIEVIGEADDGPPALAAMLARPPDVAILDLSLKRSSGIDLIKALQDQRPEVAVVVLSMHEEIYYAERALRAGARGYVMKRESTQSIIAAIHEVVAGRLYAAPEVLSKLTERMVGRTKSTSVGSVETLSDRELEVFRRMGEGQSTRKISEELNVSIKTVQAYCGRIKEKLGLGTGTELVREAVRWTEQRHNC